MNLLLLLSALLSALSGVGQAVRGGRAPQAVCASVAAARSPAPCLRRIAERPAPSLPAAGEAPAAAFAPFAIFPAEPIFAGRRRE